MAFFRFIFFIVAFWFLYPVLSFAENRSIHLTVHYKTVNFTGQDKKAIAVNNQIPAPTLHFKEGDTVTLFVENKLDKETAIHWHGLLVPWQMDGVLGINQQGIPPGGTFRYQFTIKQSGTYWYHAHAGLQEQQGLYGALVIDPKIKPSYQYDKDFVIVLSDWNNTDPDQILANLKKDGDYYSPRFPLQPSLAKFLHDHRSATKNEKEALLNDYFEMQKMRMSIYDLSDVAQDAFLLNGHTSTHPWTSQVKLKDKVRLRFIGASASTIFRVKIPETSFEMMHVDGNDIQPYSVKEFTIAPGETYDVVLQINKSDPYLIYAESSDKVGSVFGALLPDNQSLPNNPRITPFPEPKPVTRTMMMDHTMPMDHNMHHTMPTEMPIPHSMPTEPSQIGDHISKPPTHAATLSGTKYENLIAAVKTNDPDKPITGVINMELFGYMDRFIWFINGVPEQKAHPIILNPGKRYRFVFTNTSMMHHPMHIHGHWFILRKGEGAYDPLLHTIDVAPGATIVADVDTDASGQWIFHCHFLYHMMAGMARTFQYSTLLALTKLEEKPENVIKNTNFHNRPIVRVDEIKPIDLSLVSHPMAHPSQIWSSSAFDIGINPITHAGSFTFKGLYGSDDNKLELFINDAEMKEGTVENADMDIFIWHGLDQFWAAKIGVNYFYRPAEKPYWQPGVGLEGLMPYFIETNLRSYFYGGSIKVDLDLTRDIQITNNFFIGTEIRGILASKTVTDAMIGSGLNQMQYTLKPYYRLKPGLSIFAQYEHDQYYGPYKSMQLKDENGTGDNIITFGVSFLI